MGAKIDSTQGDRTGKLCRTGGPSAGGDAGSIKQKRIERGKPRGSMAPSEVRQWAWRGREDDAERAEARTQE